MNQPEYELFVALQEENSTLWRRVEELESQLVQERRGQKSVDEIEEDLNALNVY